MTLQITGHLTNAYNASIMRNVESEKQDLVPRFDKWYKTNTFLVGVATVCFLSILGLSVALGLIASSDDECSASMMTNPRTIKVGTLKQSFHQVEVGTLC